MACRMVLTEQNLATTLGLVRADIRYEMQRRQGTAKTLRRIFRRVRQGAFGRLYMHVIVIPLEPDPPAPHLEHPITLRPGTSADIPLYPQLYARPSLLAEHTSVFEHGDVAILALDGERLIGEMMTSLWRESVAPHRMELAALARCFPVNAHEEAYVHSAYVTSEYRRQGIAESVGCYMMKTLYDLGFRRVYAAVERTNTPSLHFCRKMGGQGIAYMVVNRFLHWLYISIKTVEEDTLAAL